MSINRTGVVCLSLAGVLCITLFTGLVWGFEPKNPNRLKSASDLSDKEFFIPELYISSAYLHVDQVLAELPNSVAWESFQAARARAGQARMHAFVDPRSGTAATMIDAGPLIPGKGLGNQVTLAKLSSDVGYKVDKVGPPQVADAVLGFVKRNQDVLGIDMVQLGAVRASQISPALWHVRIPQAYHGVPVRHGHMVATISHGNLVLVGTETWGNVRGLSHTPHLSGDEAMTIGFDYVGTWTPADEIVLRPNLEIVPVAPLEHQEGQAFRGPIGDGYRHRLVWTFRFRRAPEPATWEVMVDAHSAEVVSFQDVNAYADIKGGVYPVTSTEICPTPGTCGVMQSGWPMPWADTGLSSPNDYTNSGGVFSGSGTTTTTLSGIYVDVYDYCGTLSNSGSPDIDLGGVNGDHDCDSGGGSAGNTPASRTAFYEVNKLAEMARGWLPGNSWLQDQLRTNVNINNTCNAYWNGVSINFYRSGGGCRNTGELAGVFDHEWGHGLDYNDTGGSSSNPGEAYADIVEIFRLHHSCIGHGFWWTYNRGCGMTIDGTGYNANESQTGTHCDLDCSGVRDADWDKHADHTPDTPLGFVCTHCSSSSGVCGRQVHCAAAPSRQAAWDFVKRDLQSAPFNLDNETAFIIGNRVFYQGSGNIGAWHACTCGVSSDGCGATNAYMLWLAADDDDGNINNGTPHMTALYDAFNRHEIACATPTPVNSGCASGPTGSATLSATAGNQQVSLSWTAVTGASKYWVFRTEGHAGCDLGKALIAETTGLSYTDSVVANGREYYYNVIAVGTSDSCFGPVSNCASATPVGAPDFTISCAPSNHTIQQGASATSTCTVTSVYGYSGTIALDCVGEPAGITCSFVPSSVTPPVDGSATRTLTLTVDLGQATGTYSFDVEGTDGAITHTSSMSVLVVPEGTNGPQDAVYDATLQAPKCDIPGSECDSLALLNGRDGVGPEPNQPNTIYSSCADGTSGTYHSDESNDKIVVKTLDGTDFFEGATVQIDATVWAWSTGSSDALDLYYAADATSPSWVYITTIVPPSGGAHTLSATYTLPSGGLQAVRANFRYVGSASPCSTGSYDDHDDLVFAVNTGGNTPPVVTITDPPDGSTYFEGDPVTFVGTAIDAEDGDISSSISWSSDLDGALGTGATITTSTLSLGTHTITASATDSGSLTGTDSITVTIEVFNTPPTVTITAPPTGSTYEEGESTTFVGTATDAEDGDISASIAWSSDIDGALGTGATITVTLSPGTHTITASVTDSGGLSDTDTITVIVNPNTPPVVTITAPPSGSTYNEGDPITFVGNATDAQDGDLSASISWTSSINGILGTGASITTSTLSVGTHTITASVTDSGGLSGSDSITVTVQGACLPVGAKCRTDADCCSGDCRGKCR
jgi:hypothetical protein